MLGENGLICGGLIRGVVHVLGKVGLICGGLYAGGRGLIGGEIQYASRKEEN